MSDSGGPAFPVDEKNHDGSHCHSYFGMSLRDYFAAHAPEPSQDMIDLHHRLDMSRDPHNDKGLRRSGIQIAASLRYAYADAMLAERIKP